MIYIAKVDIIEKPSQEWMIEEISKMSECIRLNNSRGVFGKLFSKPATTNVSSWRPMCCLTLFEERKPATKVDDEHESLYHEYLKSIDTSIIWRLKSILR